MFYAAFAKRLECDRLAGALLGFGLPPKCGSKLHALQALRVVGHAEAHPVMSCRVVATEAGKNRALVKDFPAVKADAQGNIVVRLVRGSADEPKICGIQIQR